MTRRRVSPAGLVAVLTGALLFVWVWLFRYNDLDGSVAGLADDHYFYLARGWQLLFGEFPDRDFVDPGAPLTFVLAAVTQLVGGRGTWSEVVFTVTALSVATVLTFWAARRASGSTLIGLVAGLFEAALLPRYYNYPKVLIYAVLFPVLWSYVDQPTTRKRVALAVLSVTALLFRHDHGFFVGVAVVLTILLQVHVGLMTRVKHLGAYVLLVLLCSAPYLGWLQWQGGVVTHVQSAASWAQRDRARAPLIVPAFALTPRPDEDPVADDADWWQAGVFAQAGRNYEPWLFWLVLALPAATLLLQVGKPEDRAEWPHARQKLTVAAVLGAMLIWGFIRGNLTVRFGDVGVTSAVLAAWLLRAGFRALGSGRGFALRLGTAVILLVVVIGTAGILLPQTWERLDHVGMLDRPLGAVDKARLMTTRLVTWPLEGWATPEERSPMRLAFYVRDCTREDDRVFISPYLAQVHALAQRPFPAGHADLRPGFFSDAANQKLALARLMRQSVPLAIMPAGAAYEGVRKEMPRLDAWLRTEFDEFGDVDLGDGQVKLFARRGRVTGTWGRTAWPCAR